MQDFNLRTKAPVNSQNLSLLANIYFTLKRRKKNNYSANSEAEIRLTRNFTRIDLNTDEFSDFEPFNPKNKKRLEKFEMTYSRGDIYAYITDSSSEASSWKIGILLSIPSYINKTHCIFAVQPLQCVFF